MNDSNRDVSLPWQYTVTAFMWFMGLLAIGLLWVVSTRGMVPADVAEQVRPYPMAYLVFAITLTPFLVAGGRRQVRNWREQDAGAAQSVVGRVNSVSPAKGIVISVIVLIAGIFPVWASSAGRLDWPTGIMLTMLLFGVGIAGVIGNAQRN